MNQIESLLFKIKEIIKLQLIEISGGALSTESIKINFDIPEPTHGDYMTNVAMVYAKDLKIIPKVLADKLVLILQSKIASLEVEGIERVEVAGVGFINIYLKREIVLEYLESLKVRSDIKNIKDDKYIKINSKWTGKRVLMEYTDPNPFKVFHIGHLVQNTAGESLSRLLDLGGADQRRVCYQGDVGLHVAKTMWGMKQIKDSDYKSAMDYFALAYVYGSKEYDKAETNKSENIIQEIKDLNKKIYDQDPDIKDDYEWGYDMSMSLFDKMYERLGTKFDAYIRESVTAKVAMPIIEKNLTIKLAEFDDQTLFIKSDGAVINNTEVTGGHTRVFVNSQGLPTYEAKDIGNFAYKIESSKSGNGSSSPMYFGDDKGFDYSIISTGNEVDEYFKLINKVINIAFKDYDGVNYADRQIHISNGMLKLTTGKMSSRKGSVIPAEEMIDDMTEALKLKSDLATKLDVLSEQDKNRIEYLAINAFKFNFLKQAMGKDVIYDKDKATDVNGDSGVYINYTYARMNSLLAKAIEINLTYDIDVNTFDKKVFENVHTAEIERLLSQYDYIVRDAVDNLTPQHIAQYLIKIAHAFNKFYNDNKVFDENKSREEIEYILAIININMKVIESLLYGLGMRVIDKV